MKTISNILVIGVLILFFYTLHATRYTLTYAEEQKVSVSVNGAGISENEIQREIANQVSWSLFHRNISDEKKRQFRKQAIDMLIERELLYQEAEKLGLEVKESELKEIISRYRASFNNEKDFYRALIKQGLSSEKGYEGFVRKELMIQRILKQEVEDKSRISDLDVSNYYKNNKNRFMSPEKVRLREIFINVPANATSKERAEKRKNAEEIRKRIMTGNDFAKLAMEFSDDKYKSSGGDTGYLHVNMLDAEIAKVITRLRTSEVSGIIETIYGYYIFKLEDKQPEKQLSFDEVKDRLTKELQAIKLKETKETLINALKEKADIKIFQ
jgi:parvulin-like peptidyl-prolyl isomerase